MSTNTIPNTNGTPEEPLPETIGHESAKIPVELSTRFLEHFSEQLYSSPQKAFEELEAIPKPVDN
jgi:hypothetical protein